MPESLMFEHDYSASQKQVYDAFTNPIVLRNWLCDYAFINRFQGNNYLFTWNDGHSSAGRYNLLQAPEKVGFSWTSPTDPGVTQIEVTITQQGESCRVQLVHSGFGDGEDWAQFRAMANRGWRGSLGNLAYFLDTGFDERFVKRPMVGINIGFLTDEIVAETGLPTRNGLYLSGVAAGMGAEAAGLRGGDLIVQMEGVDITNYGELANVLQAKQAGDAVEVTYYRGTDRLTVSMRLGSRPLPTVYDTVEQLAEAVRVKRQQLAAELDALLEGVSDDLGAAKPAPDIWSVNENLAHLIFSERVSHLSVWGLMGGEDYFSWRDNNDAQITPILSVYPTTTTLVAAFKAEMAASVAQTAALPSEITANRPLFIGITQQVDQEPHTREHFQQIGEALAALRSADAVS